MENNFPATEETDQGIDTQLVQGLCVVHGGAGKAIFYFSLSLVPVKNVFLINDMQQARGFLENGPLSSHGHLRLVECEFIVEKLCSDLWSKSTGGWLMLSNCSVNLI